MEIQMMPLKNMDVRGKTVICRLDINSPIDVQTRKIVNQNRINKSIPTMKYLMEGGAKVAVLAHQGDTLDYQNLMPLEEHAKLLGDAVGKPIRYIDDVCGPAAQETVKNLKEGEAVILGNVRYLSEEMSTFEKDVKLTAEEMTETWLVRSLAPLADLYVNDAFAAAHRNAPSMVAFQEKLPTAAGFLLFDEYEALSKVLHGASKPSVFVLGGAKISDAFGMMRTVLENGTADNILTSGITKDVMLCAAGVDVGENAISFLKSKDLYVFVDEAKDLLANYSDRIHMPKDVAIVVDGKRIEIDVADMPSEHSYLDIGEKTIAEYRDIILNAGTIFANGPAGVYEKELTEKGTRSIWQAIADSKGYSVIGGGDTVTSATKFIDLKNISYVCTAGGAMVRFMSGKKLPLVAAMEKAYARDSKA